MTTPGEVSLIDARKGVKMFREVRVPVLGIIENMSYFVDAAGNKNAIFGVGGGQKLAAESGVPFLGELPIDPRVAECGDTGEPIVRKYPDSPWPRRTWPLPRPWPRPRENRRARSCPKCNCDRVG